MNNKLIVKNKLDISNLNDKELDLIQQQINERKIKAITIKLEQVENIILKVNEKVDIVIDEFDNKIEDIKTDNNKKLEVAINTYRVSKNKYGYESQANFGNSFRVSIGSGTVGKLFKIIGIAKVSKGKTEPTRESINSGKATTEIINGYETFRWNREKCLKALEKWLKENNLLEEFYSIDKEKKLQIFINDLYDKYILN